MTQQNFQSEQPADLSHSLKRVQEPSQNGGWQALRYYREPLNPKIISWVIRYSGGLVKDEKQASYVLLGFVVVAVVISLFLIFGVTNKNTFVPKIMDDNFSPGIGNIQR